METDNDFTKKDGDAVVLTSNDESQAWGVKQEKAKWADIIAAAERVADKEEVEVDLGEEVEVNDEADKKSSNMLLWVLLFIAALLIIYVLALYCNAVPRLTEMDQLKEFFSASAQ